MITLYDQNGTKSFDKSHNDAFKILQNMTLDEHNCHYCILNHTTYDDIKKILQVHDSTVHRDTTLFRLRLILHIFGTFNVLLVFVVYGGPPIINSLTCISALCLLIAPFIEKIYLMVYLESSVVLVATVWTTQSSYVIIIAMFVVNTNIFKKAE
ncbi:unnamed protein product [Rotaria socialis]|uniref:Uncharacterized protein n=1 Tax=Rotaria socialis TaxID=392032 RepID=A0A817P5E8_9BILA|nr:unnamed protein product [Rotaria socialis]CAF3558107.1 unnamed protein product [Rotaria socialis]CAF4150720.1 unnamed protein product [Rotaria socialis]CAF4578761.1 unnamed protein product [Rotaria socialis]